MNAEASESKQQAANVREVRFEYTPNLPGILAHLGASLLVSTYQAGKLCVLGTHGGKLTISFRNFERAMGIAVSRTRLAIGTRRQIHCLHAAPQLGPQLPPAGTYDGCWVTRTSFFTGNIHGHELAWGQEGLWVVNTLFSTLCTLHESYSFVPRWRPKFITELVDQDRCHLNGVAMQDGQPRFVTAMAESNDPAGWRPTKATSGCVIDVPSGEIVARGLAMPHSPRLAGGRLWVLDSGTGRLVTIEPASGQIETVVQVPGYTRGLAFAGQFAFVGLSRIRETAVFGGVPIAEKRDELKCGVAVVDLLSGQAVAAFQFHSGVEEIFAVDVLPGTKNPALFGPSLDEDEQQDVWIVPPEGQLPGPSSANPAFGVMASTPPQRPLPVSDPEQLLSLAATLHRDGRLSEAAACFEQAAARAADPAAALTDLGNVRQEQGDQEAALECYRKAVRHNPDCVPAHQNLGYLLFNHGDPDQALEHYGHALRLDPSPMNRLLEATVLPVVYDSINDLQSWRNRLEQRLMQLCDEGVVIDATRQMVPTSFFVAYQGLNDRELMRKLGRIFRGKDFVTGAAQQPADRRQKTSQRLRVGFLSAYFRDHTIGRLNLGRVQHLPRERFEVIVLYAARGIDEVTEKYKQAADRFVQIPRDVPAACRQIAELNLDVLVFADVGMDALSSTLAHSRFAPVQLATWGHPDTTGSKHIDFFISSQLLETADADAHYSEKLLRLPNLGTYMERPIRLGPARSREFFGLSPDRHVYLCPQTLFKFHPEFDAILAGILDSDREGELVLLEGRVPAWTNRLCTRFERTLGSAHRRVRFLPAQPRDDFLALLETADVVLDPIHFGGGHTSYEALAFGVPVVTWPGQFLRSRITLALYAKMGMTDLVVGSADEYVRRCVELARKPEFRDDVSRRVLSHAEVLFEDPAEAAAFSECLWSTVSC